MLSYIRAGLLELETVRGWERNPDNYSSGITNSAFVIMSRTFAPPEARLKSLTARERLMPKVLAEARANLKNPPRIYTEIAIEQMPGNISFFENDVPLAFKDVTDPKLLADFHAANNAVIASLKEYEQWMKKDLLPRSQGDFRLGPATYAKKLLYEEMVDIPLDRLLAIGYDDLRTNQKRFAETAARIDPNKTPQQILAELEKDHPAGGQAAGCLPRHSGRAEAVHPGSQDRHDSLAGAADSRRDAAVHAGADVRVHGYARPVRNRRQGGVLQRDAAGQGLAEGSRGRLHGRVQPRHDPEHRDS